jgi:hypothetical protein
LGAWTSVAVTVPGLTGDIGVAETGAEAANFSLVPLLCNKSILGLLIGLGLNGSKTTYTFTTYQYREKHKWYQVFYLGYTLTLLIQVLILYKYPNSCKAVAPIQRSVMTDSRITLNPHEVAALIYPENRVWFDKQSPDRQIEILENEWQRNAAIDNHTQNKEQRACCWCGSSNCSNKDNCIY